MRHITGRTVKYPAFPRRIASATHAPQRPVVVIERHLAIAQRSVDLAEAIKRARIPARVVAADLPERQRQFERINRLLLLSQRSEKPADLGVFDGLPVNASRGL